MQCRRASRTPEACCFAWLSALEGVLVTVLREDHMGRHCNDSWCLSTMTESRLAQAWIFFNTWMEVASYFLVVRAPWAYTDASSDSMLFRIRMDALRSTADMVDTTMLPNISRKNVAKMCRRNVERGIDMLLVEVGLAWRRPQLNLIESWFSLDTHQCRPHISVQTQ